MKHILDTELLNGPLEVQTGLRPHCLARCVTSLSQLEEMAIHLCQTWGGASNPIVALHGNAPAGYLQEVLVASEVDGYEDDADAEISIPYMHKDAAWDYPAGLIIAHERAEGARPVEVVTLKEDDPWRLIYLATLGWMPNMLSEALCFSASIEKLDVEKVIPIERVSVTGSLDDLLMRASNLEKFTPRQFSNLFLAHGSTPNTGYLGLSSPIPDRWKHATQAGPNIVVAVSPDSADDIALLWNLRALWGDNLPIPIGIPRAMFDADSLRRLQQPGTTVNFGLGGGTLFVCSESVSPTELQKVADGAPPVRVAEPQDLLRPQAAPARPRSQVQTWTDGTIRITSLADDDRKVLGATAHRRPSLMTSVRVPEAPIAAVGPLRGSYYDSSYQRGAAQVQARLGGREGHTSEVSWPSGWTSLSATALQLGLEVRESQPGLAAMNLIRAIGDTDNIYYLCDMDLVELLYELAERSGMSWWKQKWNGVEKRLRQEGRTPEEIESLAVELGRDEPVIAPSNEGRQLAEPRFRRCLGNKREVSDRWIEWAIDRRILVQGIELTCPDCRVKFWLPSQEMSPPHTCPGCSRTISRPFGSELVKFTYRIGEVLRQCLEVDALGHILALRWLTTMFADHGLVGAHPGVEFVENGNVVAEADVLLLFTDGRMVPVEVKRRATAFNEAAAAQLEAISTKLSASFDVMCVMEPLERCSEVIGLKRQLPERPRFLLTMDELSTQHIFWSAGGNPFEEKHFGNDVPNERRAKWLADLARIGGRPTDISEHTVDYWRENPQPQRSDAIATPSHAPGSSEPT
ncbi:hypothetical protein HQO24_24470 [Rhodococcus fascians]|nr:hypothetical protein [Rhodococcus fascians]MBY4399635.1 hypothetical protein [Rhodococcus fascians]MBY4409441.1 hypothetical protein [Rhodococcus fascians]MBY4424232.1 hypothetical protein [Rhodococcus fascians]MBY4462944.1 hypothetical protein [Rhodococcus fascians]